MGSPEHLGRRGAVAEQTIFWLHCSSLPAVHDERRADFHGAYLQFRIAAICFNYHVSLATRI